MGERTPVQSKTRASRVTFTHEAWGQQGGKPGDFLVDHCGKPDRFPGPTESVSTEEAVPGVVAGRRRVPAPRTGDGLQSSRLPAGGPGRPALVSMRRLRRKKVLLGNVT